MVARIFKPAKTAMQSGQANVRDWLLEFAPAEKRLYDPLMGWTGSGDTQSQVRLTFDDLDSARAYADKHGLTYVVEPPQRRRPNIRPGGYGDNFSHKRRGAWTH